MKKYTLTLDEGQLNLLIAFVGAGTTELQANIAQGVRHEDPIMHASLTLDAFSRGPKLLAILQEHKALGPEPVYEEEET
jgi:hypothetical protein